MGEMQRALTCEDLHAELLPLFQELLSDLRQEVQRILTTLETWGLADQGGQRRSEVKNGSPYQSVGSSLLHVPDEPSEKGHAREVGKQRSVRISTEVECQASARIKRSPTTQTLPARLPSEKEPDDMSMGPRMTEPDVQRPSYGPVHTDGTDMNPIWSESPEEDVAQAEQDDDHAWMSRHMRRFKTKEFDDEDVSKVEGGDRGVRFMMDWSPKYNKALTPKTTPLSNGFRMAMGAMWSEKPLKSKTQVTDMESSIGDGPKPPESHETPLRTAAADSGSSDFMEMPNRIPQEDREALRGRFMLNQRTPEEVYDSNPTSAPSVNNMRRGIGSSCGRAIRHFVRSIAFDWVVLTIVILNSILIGVQTDYVARHEVSIVPLEFRVLESLFAVLFTIELSMNLYTHGRGFFTKRDWAWNIFDCLLVCSQLIEEAVSIFFFDYHGQKTKGFNLSVLRLLRILRLVRVVRLIRVLRFVSELRTLVSGIIRSIRSLAWTMVLLFLVLYVAAVYLTQLVSDHVIEDPASRSPLRRFYGSVDVSLLSLFQSITGGIDWNDLVDPLVDHISPLLALAFALYIAFTVIAMLNIITGVFVESALKSAKADNDTLMIGNMREVFNDASTDGKMSWHDFQDQLDKPLMQAYFKAIDVDPSEAKGLFRLIDIDMDGSIDHEEFLSGCLRLRGNAKALDLNLLLHEVKRLYKSFHRHGKIMEKQQSIVLKALNALPHCAEDGAPISGLSSTCGGLSSTDEARGSLHHHAGLWSLDEAQQARCLGDGESASVSTDRRHHHSGMSRATSQVTLTHQSTENSLS